MPLEVRPALATGTWTLVWSMAVVLGTRVQPDMQPRYSKPSRTEPHGLLAYSRFHRVSHRLPQGGYMRLRSRGHESRKVSEIAAWLAGAWGHQQRVLPQARKAHDLPISAEMPSERIFVRGAAGKKGAFYKDTLKGVRRGPGRDRRTLPAIGIEWNFAQTHGPKRSESLAGRPQRTDSSEGKCSPVGREQMPALRLRVDVRPMKLPHRATIAPCCRIGCVPPARRARQRHAHLLAGRLGFVWGN